MIAAREDAMTAHMQSLDGYPADVLAIKATGEIRREDYETVLIPAVKAKVTAEGRLKATPLGRCGTMRNSGFCTWAISRGWRW